MPVFTLLYNFSVKLNNFSKNGVRNDDHAASNVSNEKNTLFSVATFLNSVVLYNFTRLKKFFLQMLKTGTFRHGINR